MGKYIIGPNMGKDGLFAGNKFPRDIITICQQLGYRPVYVHEEYSRKRPWEYLVDYVHVQSLEKGSDVIFIDQVSPRKSRAMVYSVLNKKHCNIIPLLEDVDPIRNDEMSDERKKLEMQQLNTAKYLIAQNYKMSDYLHTHGVKTPSVELTALDFLVPKIADEKYEHQGKWTICYGGNLSVVQSGFLNTLQIKDDDNLQFYVYGRGAAADNLPEHVIFKGSFSAEDCVGNLEGDWGLVWNGCSQNVDLNDSHSVYYNYVCPHKFSMYALCGMPVIVYSGGAMAGFVKSKKCGITIDSLDQLPTKINAISEKEYMEYRHNILKVAKKMAKGEYTKAAIKEVEQNIRAPR